MVKVWQVSVFFFVLLFIHHCTSLPLKKKKKKKKKLMENDVHALCSRNIAIFCATHSLFHNLELVP